MGRNTKERYVKAKKEICGKDYITKRGKLNKFKHIENHW